MSYKRTNWLDHVVDVDTQEVIQQGTPISAKNMNNIEDGIEDLVAGMSDIASEQTTQNTNIANKVDKVTGKGLSTNDYDNTEKAQVATNKNDIVTIKTQVASLASGSPKAVALVSQMTDTTKNYVYTGTESGYMSGNWYYYNGSAWVSGGVYQSSGIADDSIKDRHIVSIMMDKVNNNFVSLSNFSKWNGGDADIITINTDTLSFGKNTSGNSGIVSSFIDLSAVTYDKLIVKVNASFTSDWNFYLFNSSGAYVASKGYLTNGETTIELPRSYLQGLSLSTGFKICIACANSGKTLTISSLTLNLNGYKKDLNTIVSDIYDKFNEPVSNIEDEAVTLSKLSSDVLYGSNIKSTQFNNFPNRFDGSYLTEVIQADGSILATVTTTGKNPSLESANINTNIECKNGKEFWCYFKGKTTLIGSTAKFYAYRGDTFASISSSITFTLTKEYALYKGKITINADIPSGVACYLLLVISGGVGATLQYNYVNWSEEKPFEDITGVSRNLIDNIGYLEETKLAQMIDFSDSTKYTSTTVIGYHLVTSSMKSNGDNIIKNLSVYAETAGTYNFTIGQIDQNNLVVPSSTFILTCVVGYNEFNLEDKCYNVPVNNQVFMDISSLNKLYNPIDTKLKTINTLVQDETHVITGSYNGMTMYSSDYMIPFGYTLINKSIKNRIETLEDDVKALEEDVNTINNKSNEVILTQPNGTKFSLMVDASGNLFLGNYYPKKVVFLGNSLLMSTGGIGMCASDQYHDYYYLVKKYLTDFYSSLVCNRYSGTSWEGLTTSADRLSWLNATATSYFSNDTDLVILQLGDNINTTEKLATFESDSIALVEWIRTKCPKAKVLWVSGWFTTTEKQTYIKQACKKRGAMFVDISQYNSDYKYKGYVGQVRTYPDGTTYTLTSSDTGIIAHPGDLGMQKIADTITNTLALE